MRPSDSSDPSGSAGSANAHDAPGHGAFDGARPVTEPDARADAATLTALLGATPSTERRDRGRGESVALARALEEALDCLDRLSATVARVPAERRALLEALLGIDPAAADVIDPRLAATLAHVRTAGGPSPVPGEGGQPRQASRAETLLCAHFYALVCPDAAFLAEGAFNVVGWRRFVSDTLAGPSIVDTPLLSPIFVEELRPPPPSTAFLRSLTAWAEEPVPDAAENRTEAASLIRSCSEEGHAALDLSYLGLTSLPGALWAVDREGSACLAGGGLRELRLNGNRLVDLPEGIGQLRQLRRLSLNENQLGCLPDAIGGLQALRSLRVADNELSTLPASIAKLQQLESLVADGCLLAALPPDIGRLGRLRELDLEDNLLTSLPGELAALPSDCVVRLFQNPLSSVVRAALQALETGPLILVDPSPEPLPGPLSLARPLSIAVFDWLTHAQERSSAALARWRGLEALPHARSFALLLDSWSQLPHALSWNTRAAFRTRINDLLRSIGERPELARLCFAALKERRTDTPGDRQGCLTHLEALVADDDAQRGGYALPEILHLALQRYRLDVLETLVREKAADLRFADPTDVYLAYRAALAGRVDLPDDGYGAEDFQLAGVTPDDIALAVERLAAAETSDAALHFLIDYAPWRAGLCRHQPDVLENVLAGFDEEGDKLTSFGSKPAPAPPDGEPAAMFRGLGQRQNAAFDAALRELTGAWLGR